MNIVERVYVCPQCDNVDVTKQERKTCTRCGHETEEAGWFETGRYR